MIKCTITKYTIYTSYTRLVNVLTVSKASTTWGTRLASITSYKKQQWH